MKVLGVLVSNCNKRGMMSEPPFLHPRLEAVGNIASLWVGFKEAGDVVVDFSVGLHKLAQSEWFSDEVSGSPLFKGVVVL